MNTQSQLAINRRKPDAPLFASPWVALFLVLRKEFIQPRSGR